MGQGMLSSNVTEICYVNLCCAYLSPGCGKIAVRSKCVWLFSAVALVSDSRVYFLADCYGVLWGRLCIRHHEAKEQNSES